jgi:hypothetical protein
MIVVPAKRLNIEVPIFWVDGTKSVFKVGGFGRRYIV